MKTAHSIQARLQSRIKHRSFEINHYAFKAACALGRKDFSQARDFKILLKSVEDSQKLDKKIMAQIYWRNV